MWGRIPEELRDTYQASNWQHISSLKIVEELGQDVWDNCFKFTFVRNPYDRLVSFYEFSRSARKDPKSVQYGRPDPGTFEEWLDTEKPLGQLHYIADKDNNILMDYVGHVESIQKDVFFLCLKLRCLPFKLPKLNTSNRKPYQEYYTPEMRKKVEDIYGEEIERLGYSF